MLAVALLLGAMIGLSLGALGGGGSILTVPALVYVLDRPADQATTASLVIVGVTGLTGGISHARAGHVRWVGGLSFGLAGLATSFAGTWANRAVDPDVLLLAFAGLMLVAAGMMIRRTRAVQHEAHDAHGQTQHASVGVSPGGTSSREEPTKERAREALRGVPNPASQDVTHRTDSSTVLIMATTGLVVGFLTGFFGVGGGFVIVPALTLLLGYAMPEAVGTSLLIIAIDSAASLVARTGSHESFDWQIIIPFTLAAVAGSIAGKQVSDRVSGRTLARAFAGLMLVIAAYVAVRSISGLT